MEAFEEIIISDDAKVKCANACFRLVKDARELKTAQEHKQKIFEEMKEQGSFWKANVVVPTGLYSLMNQEIERLQLKVETSVNNLHEKCGLDLSREVDSVLWKTGDDDDEQFHTDQTRDFEHELMNLGLSDWQIEESRKIIAPDHLWEWRQKYKEGML